MAETSSPSAADLLAVRSRVSWGAIAAGAMVALTIYIVLTMLGVALGIEVAVRRSGSVLGAGAAIYSILALLLAMFFGGWATSRLAVGESKLEAVLYGLILWGVLFIGMVWLLASGIRAGFGGLIGVASGAYATDEGRVDTDRVARDLKQAGVDEATVNKYRSYYERLRENPGAVAEVGRQMSGEAGAREAARQASWWSLAGVLISLATVIIGSLVGSGELLQPVPILGVRREPGQRRTRTT
jgi:ABC-type transport system involved in multi-copper enzyme maturation permease subunit